MGCATSVCDFNICIQINFFIITRYLLFLCYVQYLNNIVITMDPKNTIRTNLNRRTKIVDGKPVFNLGVPLPTWVELSLIDVCNRKCSFCPKSDNKVAPDTFQKMTRKIIDEIHDQLLEIHFNGTISLCGYGEPLLHKDISYIVKKLSNVSVLEKSHLKPLKLENREF